jgi:protein TonB
MPITGLRSIARALLLSLSVHAALVAILWYLISTSLPAPLPRPVEVELTPRAHAEIVVAPAAAVPAPIEPISQISANNHNDVRSDHVVHAPAIIASPNSHAVARLETIVPSTSGAGDASSPPQIEAAQQAQSQDSVAISLHVLDWLARYRTYPLAARRAHLEGVVQLRVTLMPDGRFVDARVERSSGHALLDQAALDLLTRAAPLPAEFASERSERIELQLPIVYRMRASSS